MKSAILLLLVAGFGSRSAAYDDECRKWFIDAKIKLGRDCLLACSATSEDFGSLGCSQRCSYLCKEPLTTRFTFKLSALYGLNMSERALVAQNAASMLTAYRLALHSESLCGRLYVRSLTNDESDACRHFVWASLLTRDLGLEFATSVLNAHEEQEGQPPEERAMDLANNRLGQIAFQSLKENTDEAILESFELNLKRKALVILKPGKPRNKRKLP